MSLPANAGSTEHSSCGHYTNLYRNSTRTYDVTQYLQDTNSIYVYFHNYIGGYSYKISNLEFTIKTYSKLQFTETINIVFNSNISKLNYQIKLRLNIQPLNKTYYIESWADRSITVCGGVAGESFYLTGTSNIDSHRDDLGGVVNRYYTFNSNGCVIFYHANCWNHDHHGSHDVFWFNYREQSYTFSVLFW